MNPPRVDSILWFLETQHPSALAVKLGYGESQKTQSAIGKCACRMDCSVASGHLDRKQLPRFVPVNSNFTNILNQFSQTVRNICKNRGFFHPV